MTPNDGSSDRLDLEKIVTKTRKAKEDQAEEKYEGSNIMGYSMRFTTCIEKIITEETNKKHKKDQIIELKEYIAEYKRQKEELKQYIDEVFNIKIN